MRDKRRQDPREGGHTIQQREQRETRRGRPSGRRTHNPTKANKKGCNGRQGETRPSGRRTRHPTKGNKKGYNGRQRETRPSRGGTMGDGETRPSGRRTHNPTKGNKRGTMGDKGRQRETKGDKTLMKADTPSNTKGDTLRKH